MIKSLLSILSIIVFFACSTTPQPINYGSDACSFCQMTIVDRQHAAEVVTIKGKSYKYDAIECMMNDLKKWQRPEVALWLVSDYSQPGELIDATTAYYLISEDIPSPMGAFLTAFAKKESRDSRNLLNGEELNWKELKTKYQINNQP